MRAAGGRGLAATGGGALSRQLELGLTPTAVRGRPAPRRAPGAHGTTGAPIPAPVPAPVRAGGDGAAAVRVEAGDACVPTRVLARDRRCPLVLRKLRYVRGFFPELADRTLRVGLTRRAAGFAQLEGDTLWLNPHALALHTIAHELTHMLQGMGLVPGGERSCDVHALARHASLVDALPCYLRLPADMADRRGWLRPCAGRLLHALAREAVVRRAGGTRQYIRWLEREAREAWRAAMPPPAPAARLCSALEATVLQLPLANRRRRRGTRGKPPAGDRPPTGGEGG